MRKAALTMVLLAWAGPATAEPIAALASWEGPIDYYVTGAPLAVDGPDPDTTTAEVLLASASVEVPAAAIPATATVLAAYLWWAGTIADQDECATAPSATDADVELTTPGSAAPVTITADDCYCSAGATSYDIQACRADVTAEVAASGPIGTFAVAGFDAIIDNGATDNASFAIVIVYEEAALLLPRRIAAYDGLEELYESSRLMSLAGLDVDTPARGDLGWYVLDGDVGGLPPESVAVHGMPGGATATLSDGVNPADNPMNRTINTVTPAMTGVIGVDIDRLDLGAGITPGDTSVEMTYTAGGDKYWVVFNVVGINVYRAVLHTKFSWKDWELLGDPDSTGTVTPGDVVRYTIHLENSGTAPGYVTVTDEIPPETDSWILVDAAGGTDASTATTLIVEDIYLLPDGSAEVVFDVSIAAGTWDEIMPNTAHYDAGPDGNAGDLTAPAILIGITPPDDPDAEPDADTAPDAPPDTSTDTAGDTSTDTAADVPYDSPADTAADSDDPPSDTAADTIDPPGDGAGCSCALAA